MPQPDVVRCLRVRHLKRELHLQQGIGSAPVYGIHDIDTVALRPLVQPDKLAESRFPIGSLHPDGTPQRPLLHHRNLHILRNGNRISIQRCLPDFPCRPVVRRVLGEQCQPDSLPLLHQFLIISLVVNRRNIPMLIQCHLIDTVLYAPRRNPYFTMGFGSRQTHVVDLIAHSRHLCADQHLQDRVIDL